MNHKTLPRYRADIIGKSPFDFRYASHYPVRHLINRGIIKEKQVIKYARSQIECTELDKELSMDYTQIEFIMNCQKRHLNFEREIVDQLKSPG